MKRKKELSRAEQIAIQVAIFKQKLALIREETPGAKQLYERFNQQTNETKEDNKGTSKEDSRKG